MTWPLASAFPALRPKTAAPAIDAVTNDAKRLDRAFIFVSRDMKQSTTTGGSS
jgi:hypothetical protein